MSRYSLSHQAESDLLDIFVYGIRIFGMRQAERYRASMDRCFSLLAENPGLGRWAEEAGPGLRRHEHGSHVIFYETLDDGITILAVLHARSLRHLPQ